MNLKRKILGSFLDIVVNKEYGDILKLEKEKLQQTDVIKSVEDSPKRFEIPLEMVKLIKSPEGDDVQPAGFPKSLPYFGGSIRGVKKSLNFTKKNEITKKRTLTKGLIETIDKKAKELGIDKVGYTKVPHRYVFRNQSILYDSAIVLIMEMDKESVNRAPSMDTGVTVFKTYYKLGEATLKLAEFIKDNLINVQPSHPLGGQVLYPALAEKAGLGFHGRHGLLITPEYGPRVRISAIFMNISDIPENKETVDYDWIRDFCADCGKCLRKCPGQAILNEQIVSNDGLIKCIDSDKCFKVFAKQHGCSVCIKECPFNQIGYDKLQKS